MGRRKRVEEVTDTQKDFIASMTAIVVIAML